MVTSLTAFAERFKDLGLSTATVQKKNITHEQVSALFWINVSIGTIIMLAIAALSPVIAWFYADHRLVWISLAISSSFFFGGLTVQHQSILQRQMLFARLAWIQIVSSVLSIIVAIGLAWYGFGYWALVWKEVSRSLFIAAGTLLLCRWRPGLHLRCPEIVSILHFGKNITGFNIIYFFSHSLDHILIGKYWGASPLGLYRQAYQLMSLPINQIQGPVQYVALPALSALQNDTGKYRQCYKKIVSILAFLSMPLAIYLAVYSKELILLLLGEKWIGSADIFRVLAIAVFIKPVASTCGFVMVSCDKTKRYFLWGVINAVSVIIAFCIGISWGPIGVAVAYAINAYVILFPSLWYGFKGTPISPSMFFQTISLPVFSSIIMGILLIIISPQIMLSNSFLEIILSLVLALFIYLGVWLILPGGREKLVEYFSYLLASFKFTTPFATESPG
jgi:O-antigen/teichoic acid export membrane protein